MSAPAAATPHTHFEMDHDPHGGWIGVAFEPADWQCVVIATSAEAACDAAHERAVDAFGPDVVTIYRYTAGSIAHAAEEEMRLRLTRGVLPE